MDEKPLVNAIICCTSVTQEERSAIVRQAVEMGAVSQADLTSDVTHLIVARIQTEKYRFAARHRSDLKLMSVEWVPAVHQMWMSGQDVNLPQSEIKYRLPTFHGLRICVTNFEPAMRLFIEQLVTKHGGVYTGDLTKENTHLVAGAASGKKWEAVNSWQSDISIVSIEWIHESIKRGASLDEKYFKLELDPSIRGNLSWFPQKVLQKDGLAFEREDDRSAVKRRRSGAPTGPTRRLTKRPSTFDNDSLWTDILAHDRPKAEPHPMIDFDQTIAQPQADISLDLPSMHGADDLDTSTNLLPDDIRKGIFEGFTFSIDGFPPREDAIVRQTLLSNGGQILGDTFAVQFRVVPQNGHPPQAQGKAVLVTEYWLERCLTSHRFESPEAHFTSTPFSSDLPILRMQQISVCISGFSGIDALHIEKICRLSGAIYREVLTRDTSILIASGRDARKVNQAKVLGTRVITAEWLWECIRRSKLIGINDYAIDGITGSACRIDGEIVKSSVRRGLLEGVVCLLSRQYAANQVQLSNLAESMGARLAVSQDDTSITHIIGQPTGLASKHTDKLFRVSSAWLVESFNHIVKQPESAYPIEAGSNDENIPPVIEVKNTSNLPGTNRKLESQMNEIRKRLKSAPVRRNSRRILGRATTLSDIADGQVPTMMTTNEDENQDIDQTSASQGITYSDPEAADHKRRVMAKLDCVKADELPDDTQRMQRTESMRAIGLDGPTTRRLRR